MIDRILKDLINKANNLEHRRDIARAKHEVELKYIDEQRNLLSDLIHNINNYKDKLVENIEEKETVSESIRLFGKRCCYNCLNFNRQSKDCSSIDYKLTNNLEQEEHNFNCFSERD